MNQNYHIGHVIYQTFSWMTPKSRLVFRIFGTRGKFHFACHTLRECGSFLFLSKRETERSHFKQYGRILECLWVRCKQSVICTPLTMKFWLRKYQESFPGSPAGICNLPVTPLNACTAAWIVQKTMTSRIVVVVEGVGWGGGGGEVQLTPIISIQYDCILRWRKMRTRRCLKAVSLWVILRRQILTKFYLSVL